MKSVQEVEQGLIEKSDDELLAMLAQADDWQRNMVSGAKTQLERRGFEFVAAVPPTAGSDSEFDELHRVADRTVLKKSLRGRGTGSIIWGLIAIGLGLATIADDRINGILVVIGIFLTIEGIWVVAKPAPGGLIFDGIALLILGIWNLAITAMAMSSGGTPIFGILGLVQIAWGGQSFFKYAQFSKTWHPDPSTTTLQRLDQVVNYISEADMISDASLVAFVTSGQIEWKGQLRETGAIFVAKRGGKRSRNRPNADRDTIFAAKPDVAFRNDGEGLAPKTLKVAFSIKDRKFSGVMPQEAFQRYEAWKIGIKTRP